MKTFFTFYLLLITFYLFSQEQFNVVYPNEASPNSRNVFVLADTGYATVGGTYINGDINVSITITDINGNFIESKHYGQEAWDYFHGTENSCVKTFDGGYALASVAGIGDIMGYDTLFSFIMIFDENLDSVTTYTYLNDTIFQSIDGFCQTSDSGFVMVGRTHRNHYGTFIEDNTQALLLKVDKYGEYQWHKTYGANTSSHDEDHFYKVVQTPDGGYLCGGFTKSWQSHIDSYWDKGDMWLLKTDALGNQEWSRQYGHPDYLDLRPADLIMASDTSYYFVGGKTQYKINSYVITKAYILKLDKNFNLVYEQEYGESSWRNTFFSLIENEETDLILTAYFQDNYDVQNKRGILYKLNADGDSIWKRQYVSVDTLDCLNYPYSVKQCSDGGYIFTGTTSDNDLSPEQQVWLVKTDEYGCDGTSWWECATNIMINEFVHSESFKMFPNPAQDFVLVTGYKLQVESCFVYNMHGQEVKQLSINNNQLTIDISSFDKGVYFVKVGMNTQKLIIE